MLKCIDPTQTSAWKSLLLHAEDMKKSQLRHLFTADAKRFDKFSVSFQDDIFLDFSKNLINEETMKLLFSLAQECFLSDAIKQMFSGEKINKTENRAVLHTALRNMSGHSVETAGVNIMPEITRVLGQMQSFTERIHSGAALGFSGRAFTDVVNIGIGGSDLGPHMATEALKAFAVPGLTVHFVSNVDASHLIETLKPLDPETTFFLIASKTFTTAETMANAAAAKNWLLNAAGDPTMVARHFAAMSVAAEQVAEFGIAEENRFEFWDWVGGRFSLCSAVGLSVACAVGFENFKKLLLGAFEMDRHFAESPLNQNLPVIMALLGIWYGNFFDSDTEAILPYDQYLHRFVPYIQQCNMESNGKSVDRTGKKINYQTGPIVWGEPGTNGQHAFYQLLHQGTKLVPCDFLAPVNCHHHLTDQHQILLANFFAQTEALAFGNVTEQISQVEIYRLFRGNHPSNSILYKSMNPQTLGALISLYEHKIFTQGVIWNIFSFDQFGVELGKKLAEKIIPELKDATPVYSHDSSTNGLINIYKKMRKLL